MTTAAQIRVALSSVGGLGGQGWPLATIAAGADDAMRAAGITTRQGAACLVAQCMVESAYFRTTREYGGANTRYAPYYGRGFIQVTWADNYRSFGRWAHARGLVPNGNWFMAPNEDRLADPKWAWLGAVWYLTTHRHGLIALANAGDNIKVGRAINRGDAHSSYAAYGEDHRQAAYRALLNAGIQPPSGGRAEWTPAGTWSTERLQKAVGTKADGVYGNGTKAAVKTWQEALGLAADGLWGPETEKAMASLEEKIDKIAADLKEVKSDQKKIPSRVWAHQIDTPGSVLAVFPWMNKKFTAGGAQMYNLFSFGAKDDTNKIIKAIRDDQ